MLVRERRVQREDGASTGGPCPSPVGRWVANTAMLFHLTVLPCLAHCSAAGGAACRPQADLTPRRQTGGSGGMGGRSGGGGDGLQRVGERRARRQEAGLELELDAFGHACKVGWCR